jgi:riboflavin kinase/FMN adenylyltransferase
MGEEFEFRTHIIDPVKLNGHLVSSSYVRELIEDGKVEAAGEFLGRHYSIPGPVIEGYKTGQKIGFPTANLDTSRVKIPGIGVYAVSIKHQGTKYNGVVNVGFNPTFNRDTLSVEAHIFDFEEEIYGQEVEVVFIRRIRSEVKFKSADQLVEQIKKDIKAAQVILADLP